jgi:hypothetical protein
MIKESIIINMNQHDVRNLVNEPVNKLDSVTYLAHITESLLKHKKIKITVMDEAKLILLTGRKNNLWHREVIVFGILFISVVAKIKTTFLGGDSRTFSKALKAFTLNI